MIGSLVKRPQICSVHLSGRDTFKRIGSQELGAPPLRDHRKQSLEEAKMLARIGTEVLTSDRLSRRVCR